MILCICGHAEEEHPDGGICNDCLIDPDIDVIELYSHHFVPDNLGTIEKAAKDRGLV